MELEERVKYYCKCGFGCYKLYYFNNHTNTCPVILNNFEHIISKLENSQKDMIKKWWTKYSDRVFMQELYPKIGEYLKHHLSPKILDIGFENFNIINKKLLNNSDIKYFQIEPFIADKTYYNDFLLECKVNDLLNKYPEYNNYFQIILDFGVLGAPSISKNWEKEEIVDYIKNIHGALQDNGIYILKIDLPYFEMDEYKLDFETMIYPYFDQISFENYSNEIHIFNKNIRKPNFAKRDQYKFYFLKKKKIIHNLVIVAHPDDESIWCDEKLDNTTHVIVVFGFSRLGIETAKIREQEFIKAMNIAGCSYEFWNYPEKKIKIDKQIFNKIEEKIINVLNNFKELKTVFTHNEFGEYGHIDHIRVNQIMKNVFLKYNKETPEFFQFYPSLNYDSDVGENRFVNIPFVEESEKRKELLNCYTTQTIDKYRNIKIDFIKFNLFN